MTASATDALRAAYAPTGRLRAALNHGNVVLVSRGASGEAMGITVDLARELAGELGLPLDLLDFGRAAEVSGSAASGIWDVCFLAVDPERAGTIDFSQPYIRIEGCYLAGLGCPAANAEEIVSGGYAVGVVRGSAYTLHLARQDGADNLVILPDFASALAALDSGEVAALGGVRQAMAQQAATRPGARVLEPPFMQIRQAMGLPSGRPAALAHLNGFLGRLATSGRLGEILASHGTDPSCALPG